MRRTENGGGRPGGKKGHRKRVRKRRRTTRSERHDAVAPEGD